MSEFQEKVDAFKQSFSEPGFQADMVENPEQGVDVVVEEHSSDSPEASSEETGRRKKDSSSSYKNRIQHLVKEKGDAQQAAFFYEQQAREKDVRLSRAQAEIEAYQKQLQERENEVHDSYAEKVVTKESQIKSELRTAKEAGDIDREIELTDELAQIKAEAMAYSVKIQQKTNAPRYQQEEDYVPNETAAPHYSQYDEPAPAANDDFSQWVNENQWYHKNPKLQKEADQVAEELSNYLSINGQDDIIGTYEYFNAISDHLKQRYGSSQQPQAQAQRSPASNPVAPVTRRGNTMADQYVNQGSKTRVSLSPEQYQIARNLKIPLANGKTISGDEAALRYQQAMNYPKSEAGGPGTPYRITIAD